MNFDVIYQKSCQRMPELPNESIDTSLTSPPYWGLRDYGEDVKEIWGGDSDCEHEWQEKTYSISDKWCNAEDNIKHRGKMTENEFLAAAKAKRPTSSFCQKCNAWQGQLGLEPTFQLYLDHLMIVCAEIKRVLKQTGSLWLNLGDTYGGSGGAGGDYNIGGLREGQPRYKQGKIGYQKCLLGIPWRLVLRLMDEQGFILRNCIIWEKPNSMPSSAKDRLSNSYEFLFHLVKNTEPQYYWNEKTGLMADKKASKTEEKENVDWEWQGCSKCEGSGKIIERLSKANTAEQNKEPYKLNNPHLMRIKGNGKFVSTDKACSRCKGTGKIKHTFWHSLGYWYDLEAIREPYAEPLNRWGGDKIKVPEKTKWKSDDERAKWSMSIGERQSRPNPAGKNPGDVWTISTQPRPEAHFACVDIQTEALTKGGWKNAYELTSRDEIATFDYLNEKVIYHKPYDIFRFPFDGELITIENRWISQFVTSNHRILLKYIHARDRNKTDCVWHFEEADTLRPFNGILIPNAGKYDGQYLLGKEKAELLGWLITEGCITKDRRITIYQSLSANPEKVKRIEKLFKVLNIDYSRTDRKRRRSRINGSEYISDETYFYIKKRGFNWQWIFDWINDDKMPSWKLLHLKSKDLQALYKGIIAGDGHKRPDGRAAFTQNNDYVRSWFRILCLHLNLRTTGYKRTRIPKRGAVYVTRQNYSQIHPSDFKECVSRRFYKGIVWCPHVPNGAWIAGRKGKIFITGNTFPDKLCTKPILATCPAEVCPKCGKARIRITRSKFTAHTGRTESQYKTGTAANRLALLRQAAREAGQEYSNQRETIGWTDCGCGEKFEPGVLLDPFAGRGTALIEAKKMGRHYVGYELSKEYCTKLIQPALDDIDPLFNRKIPSPIAIEER